MYVHMQMYMLCTHTYVPNYLYLGYFLVCSLTLPLAKDSPYVRNLASLNAIRTRDLQRQTQSSTNTANNRIFTRIIYLQI
jgi:hypothetical protein